MVDDDDDEGSEKSENVKTKKKHTQYKPIVIL